MTKFSVTTMAEIEPAQWFDPIDDQPVESFEVHTSDWTPVRRANFGDPRGNGIKWTGASYQYAIYQRGGQYALRWQHDEQVGWLVVCRPVIGSDHSLLEIISQFTSEPQRWDACHFLFETARKSADGARQAEYDRVTFAYKEGQHLQELWQNCGRR